MLSKVLEQWEFTNKCKEVALSMTYLSVITHTKSVLYKSMWKLIWKQTNIIVQKEKISCFFFNIRRETIFFFLILLNWGKILFKCSKCFWKMLNKLVVDLRIKYLNQCCLNLFLSTLAIPPKLHTSLTIFSSKVLTHEPHWQFQTFFIFHLQTTTPLLTLALTRW